MFVKQLKQRYISLLLFFNDYEVIILCFTLISILIPMGILLERVVLEEKWVFERENFKLLLPSLYLFTFFTVSYKRVLGVNNFKTMSKIFILSYMLITLIFLVKYGSIQKSFNNVQRFTGRNMWISGNILSQEKSNTFLFQSLNSELGNSLIRFKQYPVLHSGQRCKVRGKIVQPNIYDDFNYRKYLFRKSIYSIVEVEEYFCVNGGNIFLESRYFLERIVEKNLPEPEASLLIGIMFGSKRIFKEDFNLALNSSGVSHVIAASGYNVALVSLWVEKFTNFLNKRFTVFMKILGIWSFSIFSGLSSSLIRASSMTTISLFAIFFGRESNIGANLILCVTVLFLLNPFLIHDVGFLFSFTSVVGLLYLPKCFEGIKSKFFKENILTTISCILFTLPISVLFFGKVSAISLLSNIFIVPIINSTIFWGLGITLFNIFLNVNQLFVIPYLQLKVFKYLVIISSNINMVEINVDRGVLVVGIYLVLFLFCMYRYPVSSNNYYISLAKKYV